MTSPRPYRRAVSHAEALAELARCAGTQFDPVVVAAFARVFADAAPPGRRFPGLVGEDPATPAAAPAV